MGVNLFGYSSCGVKSQHVKLPSFGKREVGISLLRAGASFIILSSVLKNFNHERER